jgi:hypothetical protein
MMEPIDLAAFREQHIELIGERKSRDWSGCQHQKHIVDTQLRRVTCKECGEVLDPIEVLLFYIDFWNRQKWALIELRAAELKQRREYEDKELRRMARMVAKQGGVWACSLDGPRTWYWDGQP